MERGYCPSKCGSKSGGVRSNVRAAAVLAAVYTAVPPRVVSIIDSALLIRRSDYEVFDRLLRGPQTQNPGSDTV